MCGIAGFYGFKNDALIKKMSGQLVHRGPDGEGYFFDENVTLLNRRLAIIDRAGGDQPIYNEDSSIVVVYNGEIYNYRQLRAELEKAGHVFKTQSDTEVIVHGYEQWGEMAFDRYNGMFGIALYDKKTKKMILARDHFGIKPLYYTFAKNNRLIFSSEITPLITSGLIEKKPNERIMYRYLRYRIHDDTEETFFDGVYKLLPGQMLVYNGQKATKKHFSNLKDDIIKEYKTAFNPDDVDKFKKMLFESVRMRLISEVPVGSALSGGIDSSAIVTIVNKLLGEKVKESQSVGDIQQSFSAVFPGSSNNEETYVNELVETLHNNISCHKVYPKAEEFFTEIEEFVRTQEEPTISTGPYAQFKVMQEASKYVTVLLDGQGADEMLAGYLPYYFVYLKQLQSENQYQKLLKELFYSWDIVTSFLIKKLAIWTGLKEDPDIRSVLQKTFRDKYKDETFITINNNLKKRLVEDIFANSLPSLLRYEDKNSMHYSLEGRVPFLDFNLLRFIFSLSDEAIIKDGWNKFILRQSSADLLPSKIRRRRNKIGFTTPEHEWFMNMKNKVYEIFLSESFATRAYFNQQEVLKAFRHFIQGKNSDTMFFWRLINIELWLRLFFEEKKTIKKKLPAKKMLAPNESKSLGIVVDTKTYTRFPIQTAVFQKNDLLAEKLLDYTKKFFSELENSKEHKSNLKKPWFLTVSEKIVAIAQGRSYFIWDIQTGFWSNTLSRFVRKTPYGIGLGTPWTMQIAIDEVGLPRILLASAISIVARPFGQKGIFYRIAGSDVAAIDGPTEYSLYPSNVSAKLAPKNPEKVAEKMTQYLKKNLSSKYLKNFKGVAIIDANDLGRNVLGNTTKIEDKKLEAIFKDNPLGQSNEQTPLAIVFGK